jgi:hypothetical protein
MSIEIASDCIHLAGVVVVEEAESLAAHLKEHPQSAVNLSACESMHSAVLQVLLALKPQLVGLPSDPWLRSLLQSQFPNGKSAP